MLTFSELGTDNVWVVRRDGAWLGTIEIWEGAMRYCHDPHREKTFKSIPTDDLLAIAAKMDELSRS